MANTRFSRKLAPDLASALDEATGGETLLDIVVEFDCQAADEAANGTPRLAIQRRRAQFEALAQPVTSLIVASGGEVLGKAWINGTLRARLPVERLDDLLRDSSVAFVDVPHRLERD